MNFDDDASFEQPQDEPSGVGPRADDVVAAGPDSVVTLPPGASLDNISAEGRDLVITLADGSRIVIPDGAVFVPQIIIDGVTVPPQTIAQLLAEQEPEPAAGPPQSSGGNFADDEGEIQAAFEIGDLLPFTDFSFPTEEEEEVFPTLGDEEPTIVIQTPDDPVGSQDSVASVGEEGLPSRGEGEPAGTNEPGDAETTTGTIAFDSPDGPNTVLINGTPVTGSGQTIDTPLGTLTIVSFDPDAGTIDYSYSLGDNTTDPAVTDVLDVTIIDDDGDQASATLTINIVDDGPIADDDTNEVPAGSFEPVTGDVLVNDVPGADGYPASGAVTGFSNESGTAEPGETLQGEYGTLTINPDGTYTYTRDPNTPGGVEESFDYTIVDADGSTSGATLTIQIADAPPTIDFVPGDDPDGGEGGPGVDDGTLVNEAGLGPRESESAGSGESADGDPDNDSDPSESTGSTIEFTSPDGIDTVTIAGVTLVPGGGPQTIVDDETGTLVVTDFSFDPATGAGSITYEYTLADNTSGDDTSVTFDLSVTDLDGDTATDELTINIADDVPEAVDDSATQSEEDAPVTVDAFANDTPGADSVQLDAIAVVDGSLSGAGAVVYNGDGTFTYTPAPGEEGNVTFDYTITDGDGDTSTATVTIELLEDSTPEIGINELGVDGEDSVDEAGLPARGDEPAGSDEASDSETTSGVIAIDTGNDTVGSLVINGVDVTNGGTVTTDAGQLTVTLDGGVYSYTYDLLDNTLTDPDSDEFTIELTDSDGDTASTTLTVAIQDDEPEAVDDSATQSSEDAPVTVDVFANDTQGADGVQLGAIAPVDGTLSGPGTLVYNGDGTFTYTPVPGEEGTVTFDYTITDGDGDVSTATVTIELLEDSTPEIGINELGLAGEDTVDEAGLPARGTEPPGSDEASDSETTSGIIAVDTGNDTVGSLVINGVDVTNGGTITTPSGQLTVTLSGGVYSYTYDLLDNTLTDPDSDTFTLELTDSDGDTASTTLVVVIEDDTPTAEDDANSLAAGEFSPIGGDVLANDTQGADGAAVTSYTGAGGAGVAGAIVQGEHGTLTINADGTYTYTRDPGTPGGVTDTFTYTITDGDGDTAQADLVITIADAPVTLKLPMAGDDGTQVFEAGLAGPPEGSEAASNGEFTQGTFTFTAPDGPATVTIGGVEVTSVGQTFSGAFGTLTIDAISDGAISYTYELTANTNGDDTSDTFDVVVTDQDGDSADATLEIAIVDDVPTAVADTDSVTEDGPLTADGNVLTGAGGSDVNATDGEADTTGADGASVTGVEFGAATGDVSGNVGSSVAGAYGAITIGADGAYVYELDNQNAAVQGLDGTETLTEIFTYTITDGDGDTSTTTVTVTINGADDPVVINDLFVDEPVLVLDEDDLADGSSPDAAALVQTGVFSVDSQDGLETLTIGGVSVFGASVTYPVTITGDYGTLRVTGVTPVTDANGDTVSLDVAYEYELADNTLDHSLTGEDSVFDDFDVVATDSDGSSDTGILSVQVIDDVATATPDTDVVMDGGPLEATGNVITDAEANGDNGADTVGADGATVTGVEFGAANGDVTGNVAAPISGQYGTLTLNADGSYTYTLDDTNPVVEGLDANESLTEVFTYTITDGDGDTATATLTIRVDGQDDPVVIGGLDGNAPEEVLDEANLPDGSSPDAGGLTQTGDFTIDAQDGLATLTVGGVTVFDASNPTTLPVTIDDPVYGLLTITGVSTTTDANGDVVSATVNYSYVLQDNSLLHTGANDGEFTDSFDVVATDTDGSSDTASLDITIVDDAPEATPDIDSVTEDGPLTADGNVLTGTGGSDANTTDGEADTPGADGATVTGVAAGTSASDVTGNVGTGVSGLYGDLEIAADGSYTYTLDNQNALVQGLDGTETLTDTFTYTITDGDGDTATTTVTITVNGADDPVVINDLLIDGPELTVDEDDLADGSSPDAGALTQSGTFSVDSADGLETLTVGGEAIFGAGVTYPVTITGDYGTLSITGVTPVTDANGDTVSLDVAYQYTLGDNTIDHSLAGEDSVFDAFDVIATDTDGTSATNVLDIEVIDDVPTAVADTDSVTEDGPLTADGNVLTGTGGSDANTTDGEGDTPGADGATVTGVEFGTAVGDVNGNVGSSVTGAYGAITIGADGAYVYELDNQNATVQGLDSNETLTEIFTYTITDGDGDTATTTVTVTINGTDDPVVINGLDGQGAEETLDEDDLPDGSSPDAGALTQTGDFTVDAQDGLTTLTVGGVTVFDAANPTTFPVTIDDPVYGLLTVTGVATTTDANGDVVSATVSYSYVLDDNSLLHTGANDGEFTDSFDVVATDTDGSTDTASLDITIVDDTPDATDNSNSVTEGSIASGNVLSDDDGAGVDVVGADGGAIGQITSVNDTITQTTVDASGNLVITTTLGTLTVNATTGAYNYASAANSTNTDAQDIFTYTVIDGDGDESTATLTIDITDVSGVVSDNDVLVNEAGLPTGSDPTSDSETDADGQITVTGATGTLVYNLLSPADGTFGTLTLDSATGEYSYTLDTPFTDTVDENGANTVTGAESFNYEVRDTLGNLIGTGSIDVSIIDDIPTATDQAAQSIAEDATGTLSGNVVTDGTPDTEGADGATVTAITIGGVTTAVPQDGSDATVVTANGTYTIDQDGNWSFDPNPNLDNTNGDIDASFTYTLTDGDGDFDAATQPISITDGADPTAGPDISLTLDDANLADGSNPTGPDSTSDTIAFTAGSDDIASIVFGDVSGLGGGLTWVRVSDTQITGSDGGRLVVTLDLSVTTNVATVTATLNDNFDDHPGIDVDDLADLGDVDVVATDADGDTASSTVEIAISDDLPTITASDPAADALTVDESDFATDAAADFSGLFTSDANADGPGTVGAYTLGINASATGLVDTATGETVVLSVNNGVVEGRTSGTGDLVFTVSVDSSGTVTLDQQRAVEHADTTDANDDATLSADDLITLSATITDSDGDTETATADIAGALTFLDDGPALSGVALGSAVDVDESDGLPQSDTSATSIIDFTSDFGADGDGGTAFGLSIVSAASGLTTSDGDFPITLVQTNATTITGTFNDGTNDVTAFTVAINSDGTVTLTQNVALEHPDDTDPNDTLDLDGLIDATVTITDGDGDTASDTVAIGAALTFFDGGPSVTLSGTGPTLSVTEAFGTATDTDAFASAFTFDGGEDGLADTSYALDVSSSGADSGIVVGVGPAARSVYLFEENGVIVGREGTDVADAVSGVQVFSVSVDESTGEVTLELNIAINHALSNGDGTTASLLSDDLIQLTATGTDNDGDSASATLDIGSDLSFVDLAPTAVADTNTVDEGDTLTVGFADGVLFNDTLTPDATGTSVIGLAAGDVGAPVSGNVGGAGVAGLFGTLTVNSDGSYTYVSTPNAVTPPGAQDVFTYTMTDGDGDTSTTTITINVTDTSLVADNQTVTVDEAALDLVRDGDDLAAGTVEGSNPTSTDETASGQVVVAGTGVTYALNGSATGNNGVIDLDPTTGEFTYTLTSPVDGPDANNGTNTELGVETFTYTATDASGNTVTGTITVNVIDDVPVAQTATVTGTVDEDGLTDGIAGGTGDVAGEDVQATGSVTSLFVVGADAPLTYSLDTDTSGLPALTSGGVAVTYSVSGDTLTASAGGDDVFTFTLNPNTGAWTFTLLGSLDHADGGDENDLQIELGGLVIATDGDGDEATATGSLLITVDDDTPVAEDDTNSLTEDTASVGGNILTDPTADGFGADGSGDPAITAISGFGGAGTVGGTTTGEWGTLTLNADGSYTYDLNTAAVQGLDDGESETDTFTYTIVDADGDPATATLTITINGANDAPVVNADTNFTLEDAAAPITGNVLQDVDHLGAPDNVARADVADTDVDGDTLSVTTTGTFTGLFGTLTLNSDGSYSYELFTEAQNQAAFDAVQALDENDAPVTDTFNYTASDGDLSNASTLTISIFGVNDAPEVGTATVATSDEGLTGGLADSTGNPSDTTNSATANGTIAITDVDDSVFTVTLAVPTETLTSGGETITWSLSTDGKTLTGSTTSAGAVLTVVIDDTGAFTVTQSAPIDHPDTTGEDVTSFTVDVNVNDGTTTTTQTDAITVNLEDDSPEITSPIADRIIDNDPTDPVTTDDLNLAGGGDGLDSAISLAADTSLLFVGGEAVLTSQTGNVLTGYVDNDGSGTLNAGDTSVFTLTADRSAGTSGEYEFDLLTTLDNGMPGVPLDIDVTVTITDGDDDTDSDTFTLTINDGPIANDDTAATEVVQEDINAAFVLDFSGSVNDSELNQQLNAVKDAAFELFESTTGSIDITLITFSSTAQLEGEFDDFAAFAAAIDGLNEELGGTRSFNGGTDFTDAIIETIAEFTPDPNANNQVFFLSDGNPNQQTGPGGTSLTTATAAAWQTFVDDNDINVTAIGVGGGINTARLQDIDVDGEGAPVLADDFEDLIATLISVVTPAIGGNILANDTPSSNGIASVAITIDGITYTFDGVNTITPSSGPPISGTVLTVTTSFGGIFSLDFSDGSYTYEPPQVTVPEVEVFDYVVTDSDGDSDTATITIDIAAVSADPNFAKNDEVITNGGTTVAIDDAWLLANDDGGVTITGVGSASSGSVSRGGGTTTFIDTGATSGSFTYTASDGSLTNNAFVTVNREQAGEFNLDGTSSDDILIGRNVADNIEGDDGDDVLVGLGGNDSLDGGEGADILTGGAGADDFDFDDGESSAVVSGSGDNGEISGFDTITDFNSSVDDIDFFGTAVAGATTSGTNGTDSTLTINGQTVKSHAVSNGIITFDDQNSFSSALTLSTESDVAAVVDYLQNNDIGSANSVVAFTVGSDTYVYFQDNGSATPDQDNLVKLEGVTITNVSSLIGNAIFPVVLDLDGDGVEFVGIDAGVTYDYDGDGILEATAWVGADDAILAFDANSDGTVTDASEFVFGGDGVTDLEAVASRYDDNGDGVLDASDAAYAQFGIWRDANLNGVADEGEFTTLEEAGIASIGLVSDEVDAEAANDEVGIFGKSVFTFADGRTGEVADTVFTTERQTRTQEHAMAAAAGFVAFSTVMPSNDRAPLEQVELAAPAVFDPAMVVDVVAPVAIDNSLNSDDFLRSTTDVESVSVSASILSGGDGSFAASDIASGSALSTFTPEPIPTDTISDIAQPSGPVFSGFGDGDVAQAMEALLLMETAPLDAAEADLGETVEAVLADIAAEKLLDQIIDDLSGETGPQEPLVTDMAVLDKGLLNQTLEMSINPVEPLHVMDGQLDQAAAAAVPA